MTTLTIPCKCPECEFIYHRVFTDNYKERLTRQQQAEIVNKAFPKPGEPGYGEKERESSPRLPPPPEQPRVNEAAWFEAVMTTWQPRNIFDAVVQTCRSRGLFRNPDKLTLLDIHKSGEYTNEDRAAILKAYQEAQE